MENSNLNGVYVSICDIIGFENTEKIYKYFSGSQVNFPTRLYSKEYVMEQAVKNYDGTTNSVNFIANKYNYSERTVRKMLKPDNK